MTQDKTNPTIKAISRIRNLILRKEQKAIHTYDEDFIVELEKILTQFTKTIREDEVKKMIKNRKTNLIITGEDTHISNVDDITGEQWISIRELEENLLTKQEEGK